MNPQILSLMGIFLALILVVAGSLRGISIIILSSVAAFLVAATGGIGLLDGYGAYLEGVAGSVTSMFPLFLGGQLLGCFLEKSGLTEAIANAVIHRSGTRGIVVAVFTVSWLLTFCGINVFVIIFTVYPIACGRALGNKEKPGDMKTPEGLFSVQQIQDASAWTHDFGDGKGEIRGAYGSHFIRLKTPGHRGIGIHGTHDPASIGTRATEG